MCTAMVVVGGDDATTAESKRIREELFKNRAVPVVYRRVPVGVPVGMRSIPWGPGVWCIHGRPSCTSARRRELEAEIKERCTRADLRRI